MAIGLYLYGFVRPDFAPPDPISGVVLLRRSTVAALCSTAERGEFEGEEGERNLQDPQWVVPRALAHQHVLASVGSVVLPVRFGAVFSSSGALEAFMARHERTIAGFLAEVTGVQEWSVKGGVDRSAALEGSILADSDLAARRANLPTAPGARYFQERQLRLAADRLLDTRLRQTTAALVDEIRRHFPRIVPLRAQAADPARPQEEMHLHLAVLVPTEEVESLHRLVTELDQAHRNLGWRLECTGPWPPYSFCPPLEDRTTDDDGVNPYDPPGRGAMGTM